MLAAKPPILSAKPWILTAKPRILIAKPPILTAKTMHFRRRTTHVRPPLAPRARIVGMKRTAAHSLLLIILAIAFVGIGHSQTPTQKRGLTVIATGVDENKWEQAESS